MSHWRLTSLLITKDFASSILSLFWTLSQNQWEIKIINKSLKKSAFAKSWGHTYFMHFSLSPLVSSVWKKQPPNVIITKTVATKCDRQLYRWGVILSNIPMEECLLFSIIIFPWFPSSLWAVVSSHN
jgi:hypothetical protein